MTHYVLVLHSYRDKKNVLYIVMDSIDYYEGNKSGATLIFLRGGNAVNVAESPEEISNMISRINTGNISLTDTRSEQERWLNGE